MTNAPMVWVIILVSWTIAACGESRGVGTPRPEPGFEVGLSCRLETDLTLSPAVASEKEVVMEGDPNEGSVCIANHFRGRVDCPYGQSEGDYEAYVAGNLVANDARLCRVSETNGVVEGSIVPQLAERRAEMTVYRSCRCAEWDGTRKSGAYCDCPVSYACQPFIEDIWGKLETMAGSYCIKSGTEWDPAAPTTSCDREKQNCGPVGQSP